MLTGLIDFVNCHVGFRPVNAKLGLHGLEPLFLGVELVNDLQLILQVVEQLIEQVRVTIQSRLLHFYYLSRAHQLDLILGNLTVALLVVAFNKLTILIDDLDTVIFADALDEIAQAESHLHLDGGFFVAHIALH